MSSTPSRTTQRDVIFPLLNEKPKAVNEKWYIVDEDWLKKWKDYVQNKLLANPGPVTCKCKDTDGHIKREFLTKALSETAYLKLVSWYGGPQTPLVRYTDTEKGSNNPAIIYYPAIFRVYIRENFVLSKIVGEIQVKEFTEYNELKERVKNQFQVEEPFIMYFRKSPLTPFEIDETFSAKMNHDYSEVVIEKSDLSKEKEILNDFFKTVQVNLICDVMDSKKHWYNGQIVGKTNDDGLIVHFFGFKDFCNETIKKEEIEERIQPLFYFTPQFTNYKIGDEILYKGKEYTTVATIEHIINDSLELKICDEIVTVKKNDYEHLFPPYSRKCKKINKSNNCSANNTPSSSPKPNFSSSSSSSSSLYNHNRNYHRNEPREYERGVIGLYNLGNTCFMNSMLQCISSCKPLTEYFLENFKETDINIDNPLGTNGDLTRAYIEVLHHMWNVDNKSYSPDNFKTALSKHCPRFAGYEQQDSHEFMSYLLDGLHEDLNKILVKPYVPAIENPNNTIPIETLAEMSWENYEKRNKSVISDLFCGMYKSHLVCPCGNVSDIFDPFTSLSLPIPEVEYETIEIQPATNNNNNNNNNNRSNSPTSIQLQRQQQSYQQQQQEPPPPLPALDSLQDDNDFPPPLESLIDDNCNSGYQSDVSNKAINQDSDNESNNIFNNKMNQLNEKFMPKHDEIDHTIVLIQKMNDDVLSLDDDDDGYVRYRNYRNEMTKQAIIKYISEKNNRVNINDLYFGKSDPNDYGHILDFYEDNDELPNNLEYIFVFEIPDYEMKEFTVINYVFNDCSLLPQIVFEKYKDEGKTRIIEKARERTSISNSNIRLEIHNSNIIKSVYDKDSSIIITTRYKLKDKEDSPKSKKQISKPFVFKTTEIKAGNKNVKHFKRKRETNSSSDESDDDDNDIIPSSQKPRLQRKFKPITLVDCINTFLKKEVLSKDNTWYCNKCKKQVQAEKKFDLWKLPEILILHIKRFSTKITTFFSNVALHRDKDTRLVRFPVELDLSEYVIGPDRNCRYELFAVSEHSGSLYFGHYTAVCKNYKSGQWYDYSDNFVSKSSSDNAMSNRAYVLFYQKIH